MVLNTIDKNDKKILKELNFNSRQSYNTIAKKTKLSKNQIVYRINRMTDLKIINKFCTVINYAKLGYHYYRFMFALKHMNQDLQDRIVAFVSMMDNVYWVGTSDGKFNLVIECLHKYVAHAINNFLLFEKEFSENISQKELNIIAHGYNLANNYIYDDFVSDITLLSELGDDEKRYQLNEKEKIILNSIKDDSRVNAIELAKKTDLSSKTIISKLRFFEKENIIKKYRVNLNHNKFDFEQYHVFLSIDYTKDKEVETKIREFLIQKKSVIRIVKSIGDKDLEFRCLVKNTYELIGLIKELEANFSEYIKSHESHLITEVFPINTVKF